MKWEHIDTAPKDGTKIDIVAKIWLSTSDTFYYRRFTDCYWSNGDPTANSKPRWINVEQNFRPEFWMNIPKLPGEE